MPGRITSTHNPKLKSLLALEKPRERRKQQQFLIEGEKEIKLALAAGYRIGNVFFNDSLIPKEEVYAMGFTEQMILPVSQEVFGKLAVRENSAGLVAVAEMKPLRLDLLKLSASPLILVLESVEKPGNLGAILRTADAAGVDAVIVCDPQTDFYNPNVIRSSVGCAFTVPVAVSTTEEAIAWLRKNRVRMLATHLEASQPYDQSDLTKPTAIVMGTESTGLSDKWVKAADARIIIPMHGRVDSMNVSVSAAVVVFEAIRQRKVKAN
jgi:TrmH family RNA methyltransferase